MIMMMMMIQAYIDIQPDQKYESINITVRSYYFCKRKQASCSLIVLDN